MISHEAEQEIDGVPAEKAPFQFQKRESRGRFNNNGEEKTFARGIITERRAKW